MLPKVEVYIIIQLRIIQKEAPVCKYILADIFHFGNFKSSASENLNEMNWRRDKIIPTKTDIDYFHPIDENEVLAEFIENKEVNGLIIYFGSQKNKNSYKKANKWLDGVLVSHMELIHEMGWETFFYLAEKPTWISKTFVQHIKRLHLNVEFFQPTFSKNVSLH